ncbi:MAG: 1-acyl-sn-glycerol-3-phosphate acyltransferase [Pseudohongiellaceae bacterium]|jgi:1-acyl-sn-glycerol-3-phosphate acyltransferase
MNKTIFSTPLLNQFLCYLSRGVLKLTGWSVVGCLPADNKCVLIGAPHTSNWDFILMLLVIFSIRADVHWMGKDSLFPKPFAAFMVWLGGIAIDRSKSNNTVEQMIEHYNNNEELVVIIPPEGTRSKVQRWKTGFYYIACGADVPIVLGAIDGKNKIADLGEVFHPSGDIDADMIKIKQRYQGKVGINENWT